MPSFTRKAAPDSVREHRGPASARGADRRASPDHAPLVTVVMSAPLVSIADALAAWARIHDAAHERAAAAEGRARDDAGSARERPATEGRARDTAEGRARDAASSSSERELSAAWVPRVWDDDDRAFLGWGVAARATGTGGERFAEVRVQAEHVWGRMQRSPELPFAPRLFGGFAFDAGESGAAAGGESSGAGGGASRAAGGESRAPGAELGVAAGEESRAAESLRAAWSAFGAATFILPRVLYSYSCTGAVLAAFVPEADVGAIRLKLEAFRRDLESRSMPVVATAPAATAAAAARAPASARFDVPEPPATGDAGESAYRDLVARGLRAIERGGMDKVVLCRARRIPLAPDADVTRVLTFLDARHTACARFFVAAGSARFLGATPERLVFVRGRRVLTEALAGSLPRRAGLGEGDARAELLASEKDRAEHAFVVAAIRAALAPVCEALAIPDEPGVRSLPHVHHLATPIAGTLALRSHALDLAARLHPTPALCGSPKSAARAFILANEAQPRGWYGGAVGWFDAEGDGAFGVAIRSALTSGTDAWIYAGAGIVLGSDPELELAETIAKERTMREALTAASPMPPAPAASAAPAGSAPFAAGPPPAAGVAPRTPPEAA